MSALFGLLIVLDVGDILRQGGKMGSSGFGVWSLKPLVYFQFISCPVQATNKMIQQPMNLPILNLPKSLGRRISFLRLFIWKLPFMNFMATHQISWIFLGPKCPFYSPYFMLLIGLLTSSYSSNDIEQLFNFFFDGQNCEVSFLIES